ncbi:hypothetical protein [Mycobacterium sp. SMC-4]|uniref:hypothetical protein n=1 Tax=Mycobacterium sp. SMC-4 TaxID=2857059 RepID=UPI003D0056F6
MYARTTTVWGRPAAVDAGIAHIRDTVMHELRRMHGFVGLSLLVDRQAGRCIATSAWQSEEAMRASAPLVREVRDRAAQILGGTMESTDWEIAVMHRSHDSGDGAYARVTWCKVDRSRIDSGIDLFRDRALPALEDLDGHCGTSLLVNRDTCRAVVSSAFDSAEALARHRSQMDRLRDATASEAGAEIVDEGVFELALAHLRVPELV